MKFFCILLTKLIGILSATDITLEVKMIKFALYYLVLINLIGIIIMAYDKCRAINHKWRVPEAHLFFIAVIFGSLGSILGMFLFHHKTKHLKFTIGMPLILIIQLVILYRFIIL